MGDRFDALTGNSGLVDRRPSEAYANALG